MSEIFADAFYYIALLNPNDRYHAAAVAATRQLSSRIVTSHWILIEVADALSTPAVRARTHRFLNQLSADSNTTIIADIEPWYKRGLTLYGNRGDKSWSLTDCISFEIMSHRSITDALTGDRHFVQAGFRAILHSGDTT